MKFFLIKKYYLNGKNGKLKNEINGGNVPIVNELNRNFNNLNLNGGSIIYRNKYKNNKIKLNI